MDMKVKLVLDFLTYTKLYKFFRPFYGGIGHIVMLHRVTPRDNAHGNLNTDMEISPEELERHIRFYRTQGYTPVSLDTVYDILKGKKKIDKFVAFTLDDGYADNYLYAYKIFSQYNIPFTINLTTGIPDGSLIMWWYLLEDLVLGNDNVTCPIDNSEICFDCGTTQQKSMVFNTLCCNILNTEEDCYHLNVKKMLRPYRNELYDKTRALGLTWEQIKEMSRDPNVTIAAHSMNHMPFSRLSAGALEREITGSVQCIEAQIGKKVEHFAYPFGQIGATGPEVVKSLGLKTAATTKFANIFPEHRNHLELLPRVYEIENMPQGKYLAAVSSGAYAAFKHRFKKIIR
jgi:peptidoglycan/xylan/chitin deacetylase (PgdA/CDA1 family)